MHVHLTCKASSAGTDPVCNHCWLPLRALHEVRELRQATRRDAAPRHACFRISLSNLAVQTQEPAGQKPRARHEEGLNEGLRSTTRPLQSCSALCRSLAFSIRTWPDSQWLRQAQLSLARGIAQCKLKAARVCAASLACLSGVYQPTSGSNAALQCHCSASCNVEHTIVQRA